MPASLQACKLVCRVGLDTERADLYCSMQMMNLRDLIHRPAFHQLTLILVSVCFYLPALSFTFVWDDRALILENWYIRDLGSIPGFFLSEFRVDPLTITNFYRPVVMVTYTLDYALWGENPLGFHLTNIVFNTLAVLLVFWTAKGLLRGTSYSGVVPWVAALLFAVHPTHVESVAFIAGRTDLLAAIFMLVALLAYLRFATSPAGTPRWTLYLGSLVSFLLSLLSKEVAVSLLAILPLYELYLRPRASTGAENGETRRWWLFFLPYLLVFGIYLALRVHSVPPSVTLEHLSDNPLETLHVAYMALLKYLQITFIPLGLKNYYMVMLYRVSHPMFWAVAGTLVVLVAILVYGWRRAPVFAFCALWYLLTLFPSLKIVPFPGSDMADRYLYLPTIGSSLILAMAFSRLAGRKAVYGMAAAAIICLVFTGVGISRLGPWKDELTLFTNMVKEEPRSAIAHNNLGMVYSRMGDTDRGFKEYYIAIKLDDQYKGQVINRAAIHLNVGLAAYEKGLYQEAIREFRTALAEEPNHIKVHYNLAMVYADLNMYAEAEAEYLAAIRLAPYYSEAHNNLGVLYKRTGRLGDAEREYREAIRYYPRNYEAHYSLAVLLDGTGSGEEAVSHYQFFIGGAPKKYAAHIEKARGRLSHIERAQQ